MSIMLVVVGHDKIKELLMAGSSCEKCIFAQWEGQSQNGCALRRLDKFETTNVINDDYTGSYFVTIHNICTAKRNKKWLSDNPRDPIQIVRKELYPKIQLVVLVDKLSSSWNDFFGKTDFSKYSAVDVLAFPPELEFVRDISNFTSLGNVFLHACLPVENTLCTSKEHHINKFVREDCQFYLLVDDPTNNYIDQWPDKLDNYINERCQSLYMVYDEDGWDNELRYNNRLIYTPLHIMLGGYGSQSIDRKINIHTFNHEQHNLVQYIGDIFDEPPTATKGIGNYSSI